MRPIPMVNLQKALPPENVIAKAKEKAVPALTFGLSAMGIVVGSLSLFINSLEAYPVPLLVILCPFLLALFLHARRLHGESERKLLILSGISLVSAIILWAIPEYLYGFHINGIVHRSLISAILLFMVAIPTSCSSLYYLLGATPRTRDISRYPIILPPVFLALACYAILIFYLIVEGAPSLDWGVISTPYQGHPLYQAGMRNHILGTLILMALTSLISLPIGVGAGVFVTEYGGRFSGVVRFSTTALRAISVFILGITAFSLVTYSSGTSLSDIFAGYYYDVNGFKHVAHGSFITAAIFLSLLVIPLIARATEEGLRSLPPELREGSLALGTSEGHTLIHVLLPWSLPNIVTGLLLGCAEAAGSVAIILFLARTGEYGIGPLGEVTSLSYFIFDCRYGIKMFRDLVSPYQYSAVLLLLTITMGLSIVALLLKRRFAKRYRGL